MANTNWKYNPSDTSDHKSQQLLYIKQKIHAILLEHGYDVDAYGQFKRGERARLHAKLESVQNYFSFPNDVLTRLVNVDCEYLDWYCLFGFCKLFDVDISTLIADSSVPQTPSTLHTKYFPEDKFPILNDEHYLGSYHCYALSQNTSSGQIIYFNLSIQKESAEYIYMDPNGNIRKLYGIPFHIKKSEAIEIRFSNELGDYFYMYFKYRNYNTSNLYYRQGIVVTTSTSSQEPYAATFVLFREKLTDENVDKHIPGLLRLPGNYFYIAKKSLEKLAIQDEQMQFFLANYGYFIKEESTILYRVNEASLLASIEESDRKSLLDTSFYLNILKKEAITAYRTEYKDRVSDAHFAKALMEDFS